MDPFHPHIGIPSCYPFTARAPHICPLSVSNLFSFSLVLSFRDCSNNRLRGHTDPWGWLSSQSIIPMTPTQVVAQMDSLLLSSVLLQGYTRIWLAIHLLEDIWVVSGLELLKPLWILIYRFLWGCKLSFLWDKCPSEHVVLSFSVLWHTSAKELQSARTSDFVF